jgi:hypothetical protein
MKWDIIPFMGSPPASGAAAADPVEWFAGLLEPFAALAIRRGVGLQLLIDSLKLALVRAAVATDAAQARKGLSDSRVSLMTGVHRKDLRRLREAGPAALGQGRSVASEVFTRWLSDPRWRTARGKPRVLPRQDEDGAPSFESLVAGVTRDVHPRSVLDELLRLGLVATTPGPHGVERIRVVRRAFVPTADPRLALAMARDNLADHAAAVSGNLDGDGRRFLEQAIFSDELTAESAARFNRETREAWERLFEQMMPRLQALHETDRHSGQPRDHRVRLGLYGYAGRSAGAPADPYRANDRPTGRPTDRTNDER